VAAARCFCQIDVLSRPKHGALTGLEIGRDDPQPEGHIEGIDAQRGLEAELADPMLFHMARATQRNSVAIARLYPTPPSISARITPVLIAPLCHKLLRHDM